MCVGVSLFVGSVSKNGRLKVVVEIGYWCEIYGSRYFIVICVDAPPLSVCMD